jgi:hypothetical protein
MLEMFRNVGSFLHSGKPYSSKSVQRGLSTEKGEKMLTDVAGPLNRLKEKIEKSYMLRDVKNVEIC